MKALKFIIVAVAVAAVALFANSCSKDKIGGDDNVTYALGSFTFDNGKPADATALKSSLDAYLKTCNGLDSDTVKKGCKNIIKKYEVAPFSYSISITIFKNGVESGFISLSESMKKK